MADKIKANEIAQVLAEMERLRQFEESGGAQGNADTSSNTITVTGERPPLPPPVTIQPGMTGTEIAAMIRDIGSDPGPANGGEVPSGNEIVVTAPPPPPPPSPPPSPLLTVPPTDIAQMIRDAAQTGGNEIVVTAPAPKEDTTPPPPVKIAPPAQEPPPNAPIVVTAGPYNLVDDTTPPPPTSVPPPAVQPPPIPVPILDPPIPDAPITPKTTLYPPGAGTSGGSKASSSSITTPVAGPNVRDPMLEGAGPIMPLALMRQGGQQPIPQSSTDPRLLHALLQRSFYGR